MGATTQNRGIIGKFSSEPPFTTISDQVSLLLNSYPSRPRNTPKPIKCMSPNMIHSLKQGYPWPNLQPTPTSLSLQTKQASSSTQIPPDLETTPKLTKCMIPNGRDGPKQGDPWKNFSRSPPQWYFRPGKSPPQLRPLQTPKNHKTPQNA